VSRPKAGTIVENEQIILKTVVFDQQSAVLKEGAAKELDHLVKYLKTFENKKIEISGYTDYLGDSVDNQILSEQRAKTIALYLTKNGIDESRVSSQGFGGRFPIVVSKQVKERNANRRVEFKIAE
jgi:OmpA-OmpF porin, OOP family